MLNGSKWFVWLGLVSWAGLVYIYTQGDIPPCCFNISFSLKAIGQFRTGCRYDPFIFFGTLSVFISSHRSCSCKFLHLNVVNMYR